MFPNSFSNEMRLFRSVALILALLLVGCSNQMQTTNVQTELAVVDKEEKRAFLDSWSPEDQTASKNAFEELSSEVDEFTKEYYLKDASYKPNFQLRKDLLYFDFFLHKKSEDKRYKPTVLLQYLADDWLFIKSISWKIGEEVITVKPYQPNFEEVMDGGFVVEMAVFQFDDSQVESLSRAISEQLEIRVNGAQRYEETTLTTKESYSLSRLLKAYKYTRQNNFR